MKSKNSPPSHEAQLSRVRRARGQVEGVEKMILEGRYCPEIIIQIRAARAALRSLEANILESHLNHCVVDAVNSKDAAAKNSKIKEIVDLFKDS